MLCVGGTDTQAGFQGATSPANLTAGLGGVIIWDLGAGYRPNQPAGQRDLLLQAVRMSR